MSDLTAPQMFSLALSELERLVPGLAPNPKILIAYRDTLLVALLLACPMRLRNLTMMEIDRHLLRLQDGWHVRFDPSDTKTRQPLHLVVPGALTKYIETYFAEVRPAFKRANSYQQVWAARKGRPMAQETIYDRVNLTSCRLFGTALSPHAFRSIAATLLAESSPEDALHARPLLGHRQRDTTEKHYIRASQLNAARKVIAALQDVRDNKSDAQ